MHYTGTIWRPPYESGSLLLEATAGCTHHRCKFCTLYDELPFRFRLSPLEDIEADLAEAQSALEQAQTALDADSENADLLAARDAAQTRVDELNQTIAEKQAILDAAPAETPAPETPAEEEQPAE